MKLLARRDNTRTGRTNDSVRDRYARRILAGLPVKGAGN